MNQIRGSQSISFGEAPYLISSACVAGSKEAEGPLGKLFDMVNQDDLFGAKTWEEAESTMQKEACVLALGKAHMDAKHVRYLYGGDLCVRESPLPWEWKNYRFPCSDCTEPVPHPEKHLLFLL